MTTVNTADVDYAAANDLAPYPHPAAGGIIRTVLMIFGIGMLFSPLTLLIESHTSDRTSSACADLAQSHPELDLTAIGCTP